MQENENKIINYPTIIGSGLVFLDIIFNNEFKKPFYKAGGTCGNIIAGLSYLKWQSNPVARIGNDIAGRILIIDLLKNGVDVKHILIEEQGKTPRIIERLSSNGIYAKHVFLLRCPVCQTYLPRFRIPNLRYIKDILEYNEIPQVFFFDLMTPSTLEMANKYRQAGSLIYFEPNNLQYKVDIKKAIRISHIVKFSGGENMESTIEADNSIRRILLMGPLLVIKTLGKYGVIYGLREKNNQHYSKSIDLNTVVDSCGAGDWFTIGFLYYLMKITHNKVDIFTALKSEKIVNVSINYGQIMASLSCMFFGARGLSDSVDCEDVLEIVCSMLGENPALSASKSKIFLNKSRIWNRIVINGEEEKYCPICLSYLKNCKILDSPHQPLKRT